MYDTIIVVSSRLKRAHEPSRARVRQSSQRRLAHAHDTKNTHALAERARSSRPDSDPPLHPQPTSRTYLFRRFVAVAVVHRRQRHQCHRNVLYEIPVEPESTKHIPQVKHTDHRTATAGTHQLTCLCRRCCCCCCASRTRAPVWFGRPCAFWPRTSSLRTPPPTGRRCRCRCYCCCCCE